MALRGVLGRWSGVPAPAAAVGAVVCLALAYGAVLHLVEHLTDDRSAYRGGPLWLAAAVIVIAALSVALLIAVPRMWPGRSPGR